MESVSKTDSSTRTRNRYFVENLLINTPHAFPEISTSNVCNKVRWLSDIRSPIKNIFLATAYFNFQDEV